MKKLLVSLVLLSGLATASEIDRDRGLYLGVATGAGWNNASYPAMAFRGDLGYQFVPGFAMEVGLSGVTQSGAGLNANQSIYDLSVKGILPLGDVASIWLQIGGAYSTMGPIANPNPTASSSLYVSGWNTLTGLGVDFTVSKNFAFGISDLLYWGGVQSLGTTNLTLVSANFRF